MAYRFMNANRFRYTVREMAGLFGSVAVPGTGGQCPEYPAGAYRHAVAAEE
jgi:hypothetical protein